VRVALEPKFACAERGDARLDNNPHLCETALEGAIRRARAAAPEDAPAAWSAVDHRVVDLAPVVPLVNTRLPVFVSKRVGNVTSHLTYPTLLDQMWVR
jgi:hypothetical protein